jgi:hypothetical protein
LGLQPVVFEESLQGAVHLVGVIVDMKKRRKGMVAEIQKTVLTSW